MSTLKNLLDEYEARSPRRGKLSSVEGVILRTHGLELILREMWPELLKLAGNGLALNGERRIRKALGLAMKEEQQPHSKDDKAE